MSAQSHRSDPRILGRRTLQHDHRALAELLRPGLSVLDIGCGIGAITVGIAESVGPNGRVVGVDRDETLLEQARSEHRNLPNLQFVTDDALALDFTGEFDIVTATRTLQWIADPGVAISNMKRAAKPGGMLVVLDYNHNRNRWDPDPPADFQEFYRGFLAWREKNGWDNEIADRLEALFQSAGLADIRVREQDEITRRGDPDFETRAALWGEVVENLGGPSQTRQNYDAWVRSELRMQTLAMRAAIGTVAL